MTVVRCTDERRRARVRATGGNGLDSVDVSARDQRVLSVGLFGRVPEGLGRENFRIDGGREIIGIRVLMMRVCEPDDPSLAGCVELTVDRAGDFATYRLCVVRADPHGRPGTEPFPGFDPRFACLEFTFKQNCGRQLDCAPVDDCPPTTFPAPEIDYLAKDYASFRQLLLDRLTLTMPKWTERHVPDLGITLVELLAYLGDQLSYRQDAVATEAYLDTARLRTSIRRHARLVDYPMHDGCAARAWVCLRTDERISLPARDFRFVTLDPTVLADRGPALLDADLDRPDLPLYEVFEPTTDEDVTLDPVRNRVSLWTWGDEDCCLPEGATAATLVDTPERDLRLRAGDVLVFEEIVGAGTGTAADADPTHRQAVRLASVTETVDELYDQPLLEVTWDRADALGFPLRVNAHGGPNRELLEVGVAHGNVVLVEHGGRNDFRPDGRNAEIIEVPPAPGVEPGRPDLGCPDPEPPGRRPAYPPLVTRFNPALRQAPVTQHAPFPDPPALAHAQARWLHGLPARAVTRLTGLWRTVHDGGQPDRADLDYLSVLFGQDLVRRLGLAEHPEHALRVVLARFDQLLAGKLERLRQLVHRARTGYVLTTDDEGWEIGQSWGEAEAVALDPARSAFRGPAATATRPDPRTALPSLRIRMTGDAGPEWLPVRDLLDSGPTDRHVVGEVADDGLLRLRFGDDTAGAAPPPDAVLQVRYRVGNGTVGNVGREAIGRVVFRVTRQHGITRVWNPLPATGGVDPEPVDEVRQRAPEEMRHRLLRAVTADDYATLAGQVGGIQRAAADLRWTGSWYEAQVAIDPLGAEVAPDLLLDEVRQSLHRYRRIGHDLSVSSATLVPLRLTMRVDVDPDYLVGHVRAELLRVLGNGVLPDGRLGFFHPDNLTFGVPVRISRLVAVAAAVTGVRHVEIRRLQRLFGRPEGLPHTGVLPMRPLEVAQLDNDPARPDNGVLTLHLRGGR